MYVPTSTVWVNQSLQFDGNNDYVKIEASDLAQSWVAEMWVKRQNTINSAGILMSSNQFPLRLKRWYNTEKAGFTKYSTKIELIIMRHQLTSGGV
ncbi:TPA: hypothetical protein EYN98_15950 [Candidatus Poribacteria bacterium]|nr:hypothetical protein [Candidatus Poribacteria bacterium]